MVDLNFEQLHAIAEILRGENVFLTGGAGTGKSTVLRKVVEQLQSGGKNVIVCAPTAAAACQIGGATIHRVFGFPIGPCITATGKLCVRAPKVIGAVDTILIDEISMVRIDLMDALISSVQKAESKMGRRIQLVVCGDFCQLPPVLTMSETKILTEYYKRPIGMGYAFLADEWKRTFKKTIYLTKTVRQSDEEYIQALNQIRLGDVRGIDYVNTHAKYGFKDGVLELYPFNQDVAKANLFQLEKLSEQKVNFHVIGNTDNLEYMTDDIQIAINARVIITANDYYRKYAEEVDGKMQSWNRKKQGALYHNGSTGTIVDIYSNTDNSKEYIIIRLDTGRIIMLYRHPYNVYDYETNSRNQVVRKIIGVCWQFPISLGYSTTVHKSQGQTFNAVNLDPTSYSPGQLYVALSRVKSIEGLHLLKIIEEKALIIDPQVKEFYMHILDSDYIFSWECNKENDDKPLEISKYNAFKKKDSKGQGKIISQKGRPARYPNGSKTVRIPTELVEDVDDILQIVCPKVGMDTDALHELQTQLRQYIKNYK